MSNNNGHTPPGSSGDLTPQIPDDVGWDGKAAQFAWSCFTGDPRTRQLRMTAASSLLTELIEQIADTFEVSAEDVVELLGAELDRRS